MSNISFGKKGELSACKYLKKKGYKILERNYTTTVGEIDIIAEDKGVLVFVEVKTRKNEKFGLPREAVGFFKQRKYNQVAMQYIKANDLFNIACRFDVIEIIDKINNEKCNHVKELLNHIENAF